MQNTFLGFIKQIAIFLICAEAVLHFVPGNSYQKYVKVFIGVIVLAQFLIPIKAFATGQDMVSIQEQVLQFQSNWEMETADLPQTSLDGEILTGIGEEIKARLSGVAHEQGYEIRSVESKEKVIVSVTKRETEKAAEVINIPKVKVSFTAEEPTDAPSDPELKQLAALFCTEIGISEAHMEVRYSE